MKQMICVSLLTLLAAGCGDVPRTPLAPVQPARNVSIASALGVFIGGPARIRSSATCTWEATVSGGTAPYSYAWSTVNGGGYNLDETWYGGFPSSGSLTVTVTDALGATATHTRNITSSSNGPLCP